MTTRWVALLSPRVICVVFVFLAAECWSGDGSLFTYHNDGPSKQCLNSMYKPCDDKCEEETCFGIDRTLYVYQIAERREFV